jgi:hypothetical protein
MPAQMDHFDKCLQTSIDISDEGKPLKVAGFWAQK